MNSPASAPSAPDSSRRKHWLQRTTVGIGAVALLAASGYVGWKHFRGKRSELDQYQISSVQRGDIEDLVTATGSLQPREYVDVGAQVSGQLKKIHVEIGSVVKAGDLLAEIDPTVYRANVDARRAALRNLQATMLDRQAQLALAEQQLHRQRELLAGDATTTEAVQQAEASLKASRAQVQALKAQIEQSESTLRADEANLDYANIYSPISGVVVSITARQGQTINANQQAPILLRVADLSTMTVQTQVSEADIAQLRPDMDAYFTTLGNRGRKWWGTLRKVEPTPTVTNNVVLYNALFDVENDQRNLLPQMTAQVFFVSATAQDALLVPASAVTIQRQPRERAGARRGEDAGGTRAPRAPHAPRPPRAGERDVSAGASANGEQRGPRGERGDGPTANMNPEERRAMFERMSPEERAAFRERRRATREQAEGQGRGQGAARVTAPQTERRAQPARSTSPSPAPVWAGVGPGRPQTPRDGVVKVVTEAGRIEERKVKVGISNRVQVQILEGLKEGEKVVAGVKAAASGREGAGGNRGGQQGPGGQGPGGMGGLGGAGGLGGMGTGGAGGGRGR